MPLQIPDGHRDDNRVLPGYSITLQPGWKTDKKWDLGDKVVPQTYHHAPGRKRQSGKCRGHLVQQVPGE